VKKGELQLRKNLLLRRQKKLLLFRRRRRQILKNVNKDECKQDRKKELNKTNMKAKYIAILNALVLLAMGLWRITEGTEGASKTIYIPLVAGGILLLLGMFMKEGNKTMAHLVVGFTFLLLIAFIRPLTTSTGMAQIRVIIMVLACLLAMIFYIQNFRKNRKQNAG